MDIYGPEEFIASGLFCMMIYLIVVIVTLAEAMAKSVAAKAMAEPVMAVTECMMAVRISTEIHMAVAMPPTMTMIPSIAVMIPVTMSVPVGRSRGR